MLGNNLDTDVLVIGAGPVGLIISSILHHNGLKVMLVDKNRIRPTTPRGIAINQATLDVFKMLGLEKILSTGLKIDHVDLYWKTKKLGEFNFHNIPVERPYFFHIFQNDIEKYLEENLKNTGFNINKGLELINYSQKDKTICSVLKFKNKELQIRSTFLIGCDGGHSKVREIMGSPINQRFYGPSFIIADVKLNSQQQANTQYIFTPSGYVMIVPAPENIYRLIFSVKDQSVIEKSANDIQSKTFIEQLLYSRLSKNIQITEILWATHAQYGHRISENIYQNRVVLAGDSMHQFSPVGGTNMNIGIQDAYSLAWRIVHMHKNSSSLLDEYETERKTLINKQQYMTEWVTALITRNKKYPDELDFSKNITINNLEKQLTGFYSSEHSHHLQYYINYKEHKNIIKVAHKHFLNTQFVLLTIGDLSNELRKSIELFLLQKQDVQWINNASHAPLTFFYCRPDSVVIHSGSSEELHLLCHSISGEINAPKIK